MFRVVEKIVDTIAEWLLMVAIGGFIAQILRILLF